MQAEAASRPLPFHGKFHDDSKYFIAAPNGGWRAGGPISLQAWCVFWIKQDCVPHVAGGAANGARHRILKFGCVKEGETMKTPKTVAITAVLIFAVLGTSCGTVTGAVVGAGAGAAIGAGTGHGAKEGALIGAGVGGAAGAIYDLSH